MKDKNCRSTEVLSGDEAAFARSLYKSMGYSNEDIKANRPVIGIANSWTDMVPGHFNLKQMAEQVRKGIYRAGGTAVEFGIIATCDGITMGHNGMHYSLPSRELICDSVETCVEGHHLDGVILLASCDKIVPGMLMAAARMDIPAIVLHGGPMAGGVEFDGRASDGTSVAEALGMLKAGKITAAEYEALEDQVCPSCGSCSFFGTANTMCSLTEALGMCLPGEANIPATHSDRLRIAVKSGERICEMVAEGLNARQIISRGAMENAIKTCIAIGGSTNAVLHLCAIAYEAELGLDVVSLFEKYAKTIPTVAKMNPASIYNQEDFWVDGGMPRVLENLESLLDSDAMTCTGHTVKENIGSYVYKFPATGNVVKSIDAPFSTSGGIAVLRGNLAERTGISKPAAIDPSVHRFTGKACVFDYEEAANKAILDGKVGAGNVVVIRYEGPKGGPGMREMFMSMKYLHGMGLDKCTAVVTDGRFSGTNNGCFVGHVSPEAAEGGVLAVVEDGDEILIDVNEGILELKVSEDIIKKRKALWTPPAPKFNRGYLSLYSRLASSACEGAIIRHESIEMQKEN